MDIPYTITRRRVWIQLTHLNGTYILAFHTNYYQGLYYLRFATGSDKYSKVGYSTKMVTFWRPGKIWLSCTWCAYSTVVTWEVRAANTLLRCTCLHHKYKVNRCIPKVIIIFRLSICNSLKEASLVTTQSWMSFFWWIILFSPLKTFLWPSRILNLFMSCNLS